MAETAPAAPAVPENKDCWDDTQIQHAFNTICHQHGQFRINSARIVSPLGYEPKEISVIWESLDTPDCRQYVRTRGLVSKRRAWMPMTVETDKNWKYLSYFMSDDGKLCGFVSEALQMDHKRDVIQIESMKYNKAIFCIYLDAEYLHGPIILVGENTHFKLSGETGGRKLLYFAYPNAEQEKTKNRQDRLFVICIYDFETKGVTVISDENICEETINSIEWTPDGRGVIFHRKNELLWYRFGEQYVNKIYSNIPVPLRITFSPDEKRLAVFLPTSAISEKSILLFHWPFVKAAVQFQHDVITLGSYKVWSVPDRPWSHGGTNLVFNANWQHHVLAFSLVVDKLSIHKLRFPRPSLVVDVQNDEMLFETVAANAHSRLWISNLSNGIDKNSEFSATLLAGKRAAEESMFNFNVKPVYFDNGEYTGVLYLPPDSYDPGCKIRLVVYPHAGDQPNHTLVNFSSVHPLLNVLINWGHAILIVNHREPFVLPPDSDIPEFTNSQDIEDFHNAVVKVISDYDRLDDEYVCLYGYMYGSYVAANVIKRYPEFYKCAALVHPILHYPYIPEDDVHPNNPPLQILDSRQIKIPTFLVLDRDEDHEDYQKYRKLAAKGVQCFGHSELEDEEYYDYIVKILHFFKYPYDAFPRRVDDNEGAESEVAQENK